MALLIHSKRPPPPMKARDFDHEIELIDHTRSVVPKQSQSRSSLAQPSGQESDQTSESGRNACFYKNETSFHLRKKLIRRKFSKYQDRSLNQDTEDSSGAHDYEMRDDSEQVRNGKGRGRSRAQNKGVLRTDTTHEGAKNVAVDILFENQRGGFVCGKPLFSARALGNLDPAPWTNVAQKPSATNISTAQPPDPSWEWAWQSWSIHHTEYTDEGGWEYSFAFHGNFSWRRGKWWNSFVRRRAWVRKRVKKKVGYQPNEDQMPNSDYFTVEPARVRSQSSSSSSGSLNRYILVEVDEETITDNISDIDTLKKVLRCARIDREKIEAVENFVANGKEELIHLKDQIHYIMQLFIFEASRRSLVDHLRKILNEERFEQRQERLTENERKRHEHLEAVLRAAEEEVKGAELWSDENHDKGLANT